MLTRRGFVKWGLAAALPVVITAILVYSLPHGAGVYILFLLFFSEISVFAISIMAASFLNRSKRFMLLVSAGVTSAYACYVWYEMSKGLPGG